MTGRRRRGTVKGLCGSVGDGQFRPDCGCRAWFCALRHQRLAAAGGELAADEFLDVRAGLRARRAPLPACDYPGALDRIIANFHTKEYRFWNSELRIVGVENIHESAWLPWAAQSIPRRFCSGTAVINDGTRHPLFYSIAEDTDIDGFGWGINFCVDGLDRNDAYNPHCRSAPSL